VKLKTPFTFAGYSFTGRGSLFDADNEMVIVGINSEQGQEIARRINAYDVLVEACEAQQAAIERIIAEYHQNDDGPGLSPSLYSGAQEKARYAFALVRGEGNDA